MKWLSTSSNGRSIQFALKETRDICVELGKAPRAVDYYHGELYSRHIDGSKGMTEGGVNMETIRMALSHLLKGSYMIMKTRMPATVVGFRYIEGKHVGGPERVDISHHYELKLKTAECDGDDGDGGGSDGDGDGDGTSGGGKRPRYNLRTNTEQPGEPPFVTLADYKDTLLSK